MSTDVMQQFLNTSALNAGSMAYLEELYETYLENPNAVDEHWRHYFDKLPKVNGNQEIPHLPIQQQMLDLINMPRSAKQIVTSGLPSLGLEHERKQMKVVELIEAYRLRGHEQAKLDPLALNMQFGTEHKPDAELSLAFYDLRESDLDTIFNSEGLDGLKQASLREIYKKLNEIYCSSIGAEYMYITDREERDWIRERLEKTDRSTLFTPAKRKRVFEKLNAAQELEEYLHTKYVGQKRFSLEGGDTLIPMVDEIIQRASQQGMKELLMGMAHRGRLNVLINILGKVPKELFNEFEGKHSGKLLSGDVKYHQGFSSTVRATGGEMHLALAFNPSHLEIVGPVVEGSVRARQDRRGPKQFDEVMPLLMHGDAAFAGQGVIMEMLNMSQTRGYKTGGTVHIVINNQVGFTTSNPEDARSTTYCTDVAKMIEAPIFHVNADDVESAVFLAELAVDYRKRFRKDIVIDLVCYRRHGHNEADEPSATQPIMYQVIKQHETPTTIYAKKLMAEGTLTQEQIDAIQKAYLAALDKGDSEVVELEPNAKAAHQTDWKPYLETRWTDATPTTYPLKDLTTLAEKLVKFPAGFKLQTQVGKMVEHRQKMLSGEAMLDWGAAENLAYATLLTAGYPVRISGQDVGRGTFAHRHAVFYDYNNGQPYIPLQHLDSKQASFSVIDSLLSEEAVMAFEYGYASAEPRTLDIWEGQFGDFANGAQVVIDQFLTSGEVKWGRLCGLTLLLPHGYEGMGPEHSSARLERYLQLCANDNIQVCVPSTPAQVYHMLRRQMLRPYRKPLVVMSPKSLLRHKLAVSSMQELAEGHFQNVIGEIDAIDAKKVRKVILCSGKVYYDLLAKRRESNQQDIAIVRIEQLYPFPRTELENILSAYVNAKEIVWCQEEPKNQGAWYCIRHRLEECLRNNVTLVYAGRKSSAAPAVGYLSVHMKEQAELVEDALK